MKFLGKLKPFVLPFGIALLACVLYDKFKNKLPMFMRGGMAAIALLGILTLTTPARAEVITKGGAIQLRPTANETAKYSYTNAVANPGLPALLRITTWQFTNHLVFTTNGVIAVVNLGTNFVGFTGVVNNPSNRMYFKHGFLSSTNDVQSP